MTADHRRLDGIAVERDRVQRDLAALGVDVIQRLADGTSTASARAAIADLEQRDAELLAEAIEIRDRAAAHDHAARERHIATELMRQQEEFTEKFAAFAVRPMPTKPGAVQ